jgi:hypothetical protein
VLNAVLLPSTIKGNLKFRSHPKQNIKHDCVSRQQNKQTNNVTAEIGALNKIVFLFIENRVGTKAHRKPQHLRWWARTDKRK